tara:strand:+ start:642 stop:1604 length:963 start_codon:yes stop_codon:yes gene_type:complete
MALAAQNQVRNLYVGLDFPGHATVGAVKSGSNGDLALLSADGTVAASGENFMFLLKGASGTVVSSDLIKPSNVLYAKSIPFVAQTMGTGTISALTVDVNTLYTVEIAISGFGSLSREDEYLKKAFYKAVTGDDQEAIVDGLIVSLNRNFSREVGATASSNPSFAFTKTGSGATAALVITEKPVAKFDANKMTRKGLDFRVNCVATTTPTIVNVAGTPGVGTGMEVAENEFYLKGERNDYMRGAGYPHNLNNVYLADASASYNTIEVGFYEEGRDEAKKSKKSITINVPFTNLAGNSVVNDIVADLNTILGAGSVDAFAVA